MGSFIKSSQPLQICLNASQKKGSLVSAVNASAEDRKRAEEVYYPVIFQYTGGPAKLPYALRYMTPNPILVSNAFLENLREFHDALSIALTNIVQRWFTDEKAAFPSRMPLEEHEEALLQWLQSHAERHPKHAYKGNQGTWRPDFLIPADEENGFTMCEINARFFSLGIDLATWIHRGLADEQSKPSFLDIPENNDKMIEAYFRMFNPDLPIHLLQSEHFLEARGRSSIMEAFLDWVEGRTGKRPISVRPENLRVVPDDSSETGHALYYARHEDAPLEKIHQIGLQINLDEGSTLDPEISRYIALYGVNDTRSRLIAHDKRVLGIIHQELDDLVTKHGVLTKAQATLLRARIVPTFIPGSEESKGLLHSHRQGTISKDDFIIKPARGGRGQGIKFGDEIDDSEWESVLEDLQKPGLSSDRATCVVQKIVKQVEEDMFLDEEVGVQRCQRVGTYYATDGEYLGLGAWRAIVAKERVCNMSLGRAWKMGSVVQNGETTCELPN